MITIQLNGFPQEIEGELSLRELVLQLKIRHTTSAIAVNSEVVPRSAYGEMKIKAGDQIEVVAAVGGG